MVNFVRQLTQLHKIEIDHLFKNAKVAYKSPDITILCAPKQKEFGRALFITSRKIGTAPERNRLRRQLKAIFYQEKLYAYGFDCAFITRASLKNQPFQTLKAISLQALEHAKTIWSPHILKK